MDGRLTSLTWRPNASSRLSAKSNRWSEREVAQPKRVAIYIKKDNTGAFAISAVPAAEKL